MKSKLTSVKETVERDDAGGHIHHWLSDVEDYLDLGRPVELEGDREENELQVIRQYFEVNRKVRALVFHRLKSGSDQNYEHSNCN